MLVPEIHRTTMSVTCSPRPRPSGGSTACTTTSTLFEFVQKKVFVALLTTRRLIPDVDEQPECNTRTLPFLLRWLHRCVMHTPPWIHDHAQCSNTVDSRSRQMLQRMSFRTSFARKRSAKGHALQPRTLAGLKSRSYIKQTKRQEPAVPIMRP